jgi:aminoglycoside phosphotransferase (APT) family kinase protein
MLVDDFLPSIAEELRLQLVAPLRHGEFGASLVRDANGQDLVLKAVPGTEWASRFAASGELVERLRARGYPAPAQLAAGVCGGASWSLQERLPGDPPDVISEAHVRTLVELAHLHRDAAGRRRDWLPDSLPTMLRWIAECQQREETRALARFLMGALSSIGSVDLRCGDVIHNDFSHRNYLAVGVAVTGVVDWEQADAGDWRIDLVSLEYGITVEPGSATPEAARVVSDAVRSDCPGNVRALFSAYQALRHLDYVARLHPARLPEIAQIIEARVAPSWRPSFGPRAGHAAA